MDPVFIISGKIGSGKTTLAQALAEACGFPRISFSDVVRMEAKKRGLGDSRDELQTVGEDLVAHTPREFCERVLVLGGYEAGKGFVVDGLRHIEILHLIKSMVAPQAVTHLHIASPEELRIKRLEARGRAGESTIAVEHHSTEIQLGLTLPSVADHLLDGSLQIEELVGDIRSRWAV